MRVSGWGRYPWQDADVAAPTSVSALRRAVATDGPLIARGLGRSYGDSALAPRIVGLRQLDHFLDFDASSGRLRCEAGVSLADILLEFVPRGWFVPVTPGTRFVTVGGAVASDVHGKNHHVAGAFSDHVESLDILLGSGEILTIGPTAHPELFHATCGGMGLTGIILTVTLRLLRIASSRIVETTIKAANLDAAVEVFAQNAGSTYSVAWIDCLARGSSLGRSLIMLGEHSTGGALSVKRSAPLPIPVDVPSFVMNPLAVRAFNTLYFNKALTTRRTREVPLEPYFYPLDALTDWNRLYGSRGFIQYQFVLPLAGGLLGLRTVLERIARSGSGSFLAVLKVFGRGNSNLLSFPMEGYTLALDFQVESRTLSLLDDLDSIVREHGGRIYLTKDSRMSAATFRCSYPRWEQFESVRLTYHASGKFRSLQSKRLGLS